MIVFPGDDQLENPTGQSRGALGIGGAEQYGAINGNSITVTNLNASAITAGTIDASVISVTNINASNISTGTLSADRIASSSISASKLDVETLSAISANLGTVTAGTITGVTINGSTINAGYNGGALNVYGNNFNLKDTGGTTRINIWHTGTSSNWSQSSGPVNFEPAINANGGVNVAGCFSATPGNKFGLSNNIDMNEFTIDACDTIWAYNFNSRCEVADGINPFRVMESFKSTDKEKSKHWKKLDHNKLDKEVYDEGENGVQGYSLNKLVELQRQAILQLKKELDEIKNDRGNSK
jgi:uncharacterized protein YdcH (DUF465 family)